MKTRKSNKSNRLGGKKVKGKMSNQEAIALALAPKIPKPPRKPGIIRDINEEVEYIPSNINQIDGFKDKFTLKELKFLRLYLAGNITKIMAMKSVGYEAAQDTYLYLVAKRIIERYESEVEDHRIIFRGMGAGEVFVAKGLIKLAKESNSDMVKLNAYTQLAKILGLTKEQIEGAGGVTVIFESGPGPQPGLPGTPPPPPGSPAQPAALPAPGKAIMITK